jgi:ketosteroid isomerase-like protein
MMSESRLSDKKSIAETISASIAWALKKDTNRLYGSMVQDGRLFIFHPDSQSTIRGIQAFKTHVERVFLDDAFRATGFEIKELSIQLADSGNMAWFSCFLDDHYEWDGQPGSWIDVRWTGILEKQRGQWKIVQMHFSKASN